MKTTQTILHQEKLSPVVIVVLNKYEDNTENSDKTGFNYHTNSCPLLSSLSSQ